MSELIDRQAAIDALDFEIVHMTVYCDGENEGNPLAQYNKGLEDGKKAIEALPPTQPERKKGEWLPDNNNAYEMRFVCSCCKESEVVPTIGFTKYKPLWDFCPNCGADMRGEKDG